MLSVMLTAPQIEGHVKQRDYWNRVTKKKTNQSNVNLKQWYMY